MHATPATNYTAELSAGPGKMEGLAKLPKNLEDLPKRLEDLKKYQQDTSEEAKERRRRQQGCPRILNVACGIAMVAIGMVARWL